MTTGGLYSVESFRSDESPQKGDERLVVRFFSKARLDQRASDQAGKPTFKDETYISIRKLGDSLVEHVVPARASHKRRFARQWEAFTAGADATRMGHPLSEWPPITRSEVEELALRRVYTVEQLSLSDPDKLGIERAQLLVVRAQDHLEAAKDAARDTKMRSELEQRDALIKQMRTELEEQRRVMDRFAAQMEAKGDEPKASRRTKDSA